MPHPLDGLRINTDVTAKMLILHPITKKPVVDNAGIAAVIELLPFESSAGRALDRKHQDESIKRNRPNTRDENEAAFIEKLASITKNWYLVDLSSGEPMNVPCTADMAHTIYSEDSFLWLKAQVVIHSADLGNFPGVVSAA